VAQEQFDAVIGDRPNQVDRRRDEVEVSAADLLDLDFPGDITLEGVRTNVSVGIRYLWAWLSGTGAAAIDNLMEDVATAEISRSQIWQWVHHGVTTSDGTAVTESLVRSIAGEVVDELDGDGNHVVHAARKVFEEVALSDDFVDFLTLPAYELIN
jgi:malate synthase